MKLGSIRFDDHPPSDDEVGNPDAREPHLAPNPESEVSSHESHDRFQSRLSGGISISQRGSEALRNEDAAKHVDRDQLLVEGAVDCGDALTPGDAAHSTGESIDDTDVGLRRPTGIEKRMPMDDGAVVDIRRFGDGVSKTRRIPRDLNVQGSRFVHPYAQVPELRDAGQPSSDVHSPLHIDADGGGGIVTASHSHQQTTPDAIRDLACGPASGDEICSGEDVIHPTIVRRRRDVQDAIARSWGPMTSVPRDGGPPFTIQVQL